jgi:AraC-like DNA-binding protein
MVHVPWWQKAAPVIHTAGGVRQGWLWEDPLRVLHDHELFVVGRGFRGSVTVGTQELPLDGPAWAIIPSGLPHICRGEASSKRRGWVHFDWMPSTAVMASVFTYGSHAPESEIHRAPDWAPAMPACGRLPDDRAVDLQFELTRAWSHGDIMGAVRSRCLLLELLVRLLVVESPDQASRGRALAEQVRECLDRIAVLPVSQTPSLPQALQKIGRGSDHLARVFRHSFGVTPVRYLLEQRVGRACAALAEGTPLSRVALELGFADSAYLNRLIRRISGHPARWHADRGRSHAR